MATKSGNKGKVCVTGASGFLASWLVKRLLESGYHVIATVRNPGDYKKVGHLLELQGAKERLQLVKADLMEPGSFDDAVMGCEGVFHMASPVIIVKSDPKAELVNPAVDGTLNVLQSCKRNPALRRVVVTSSSSTTRIRDDIDPMVPLDESSWSSVELCERSKLWYPLAKTLAEKRAWEFAEANGIDLVTVIPSFAIGPSLPRDLCLTLSQVASFLGGNGEELSKYGPMGYVHIDDVARCHILVYEDVAAHGRYICDSRVMDTHELAALLVKRHPSLPISASCKQASNEKPSYEFDTSKLRKMGFQFKGVEEMFDDCIQFLKERGYLTSDSPSC